MLMLLMIAGLCDLQGLPVGATAHIQPQKSVVGEQLWTLQLTAQLLPCARVGAETGTGAAGRGAGGGGEGG